MTSHISVKTLDLDPWNRQIEEPIVSVRQTPWGREAGGDGLAGVRDSGGVARLLVQ